MKAETRFRKLNDGWNAEPNAPEPSVRIDGEDVVIDFLLNPWQFPEFSDGQVGHVRFRGASRYRLGTLNDEGWVLGQGRFDRASHEWGEFYEIDGDLRLELCPDDWVRLPAPAARARHHYLFYFRDEDFECDAEGWTFSPSSSRV